MVHECPAGPRTQLRSLRAPILLIFGDRDFSPLPRRNSSCSQRLPDAQLAVLPGTTHMGVTQQPDRLLALITPFLNSSDR